MKRSRASSFVALTNVEAICYPSSSPIVSDSLFTTRRANMRANCGSLKRRSLGPGHIQQTTCAMVEAYALAIENLPTQQLTARPPVKVNMCMMSFIHNTFFRSKQSNSLEPDAIESARKTRSSCGRRGPFGIWFVHLWFVDFRLLVGS